MLTNEILSSVLNTEDFKSVNTLKLEGMELNSGLKLLLQHFGITLYLLSLKNNSLTEVDINLGFSNLHKLDLSTNFLINIGSKDLWSSMPRLQILYLHDNLLESWSTFESLSTLPSILHLTLFNNPCIHLANYRKFMITSLHTLLALDFYICTEEEKRAITPLNTESAKVWIQDTSDIRNFKQHIYKLRRKWEKCSPVIKIQTLWRRYKVRKNMGGHLSERDKMALIIQKHIRGWLLRKKLKNDLEQLLRDTNNEHLLFSPEDYAQFKAVKIIENWYYFYKQRKLRMERRNKASTKIASCYRKWKTCRIKFPICDQTKIYILKSQQRTLICFLRAMSVYSPEIYHPANNIEDRTAPEFFENLKKVSEGFTFADLFERISDCKSIKLIRFPDIDSLAYSDTPIIQLVKWVKFAKICNSGFHHPIKNVPISKKYCRGSDFSLLNKFKNRGCKLTKEEKEEIAEIQFNLDDYLDLVEFQAPSSEFLREFLQLVFEYNKYVNSKDFPIFVPLYEILVQRVKAVCTIQSCWKGHKERKTCELGRLAINRRAAVSIQRWWRMVKYTFRMNSLTKLKAILLGITDKTLYMQEHFFQYLCAVSSGFMFTEQIFSFFCREDNSYLVSSYRSDGKLLPAWLGTQLYKNRTGTAISEEERTLQAVVLSGARVDIVTLSSQVTEAKVADPNLKFLKLEFCSVEEAKRRVAMLFLKTFNYRNRSYVPLFTLQDLNYPFLMSKLRSLWTARNINPAELCPSLNILKKALSPIEISMKITPTPPPATAPTFRPRPSERLMAGRSEAGPRPRNAISSHELLRKRVQKTREESARRLNESKISKQIDLEVKMQEFREAKEHIQEIMSFRQELEQKQVELRRGMIEAQSRKKAEVQSERQFIKQFAQAKNMLQKLMKNSDMSRWRHKSKEDVRMKVEGFKQKSKERKEFIHSMMYEKYKSVVNKTIL